MTIKNRNLAKGMLPALLLSAALSVPATALAAPASHGKAHAAEKAKSHQEKAQQHAKAAKQNAQQARKQAQKAEQQARKAQQAQRGRNQKQAAVVVAPQRRVVVAPQRVVVPQRRVVVVPAQPVGVAQRNRAQYDGWNRRYNKYSTGLFELEATSVGRQQGCALVRDSQGQVIPLVGIDPLALRTGEHILFSGRIQNNTACGTAFRVNRVERVWTDASHRRLLFDSRRDGDYVDYHSRERYNDRDRYDDRYARDRDRNDDRYDDDRYDRYDDRSDNRVLTVDGRIDDRGRCTAIRGDRGEYYDLLGDLRGLGNGEHVRVIGYPGVRSSCGGQAIEIQEIRRR